ncbi:hypothetical protein X777_06292 [Ooceraea biroi]|uniref:Uncharacterized protein n=1 Tax=Ooceraea biroi TaxID=2015173 RepID=A0A026WB96_OOCBI|nr:hypothetical protein X777_06292 [Ooceraea biroi]
MRHVKSDESHDSRQFTKSYARVYVSSIYRHKLADNAPAIRGILRDSWEITFNTATLWHAKALALEIETSMKPVLGNRDNRKFHRDEQICSMIT